MTNCAPLFGTTPEEAHITASTNYFTVVCFHSVAVFIAWAWMLSRRDVRRFGADGRLFGNGADKRVEKG